MRYFIIEKPHSGKIKIYHIDNEQELISIVNDDGFYPNWEATEANKQDSDFEKAVDFIRHDLQRLILIDETDFDKAKETDYYQYDSFFQWEKEKITKYIKGWA